MAENNPIFDPPPLPAAAQEAAFTPDLTKVRDSFFGNQANLVKPDPEFRVSNLQRDNTALYINGILTDHPEIAARMIANMRGKPVEFIHNTSHGAVRDIGNSIAGTLSPELGRALEKEAVIACKEFIRDKIKSGDIPVEIYAHSQGNIILDNALMLLTKELIFEGKSTTSISNILSQIIIYRYGTPSNNGRGAFSVPFEHQRDPVAKLGSIINWQRQVLSPAISSIQESREPILLKHDTEMKNFLDAHKITEYLADNPEYYDIYCSNLSPMGKAGALVHSIQNGNFSDREHERILKSMLESRRSSLLERKLFAQAVLRLAPNGQIGNFTFSESAMQGVYSILEQ